MHTFGGLLLITGALIFICDVALIKNGWIFTPIFLVSFVVSMVGYGLLFM